MKQILFVTGNLGRGGAQRVISLLANEYAKAGWSVHMVTLLDNNVGYKINDDIILHDLSKKGSYYKNIISWIIGLRKLLKEVKPDVVLSFVGRVNIITMLAGYKLNIPIAVSERNDPAHDRRSKLEINFCKIFYSKADLVVFQTNYQKEYYGKFCSNNSVIIGNPIAALPYEGNHVSGDIISVGKLMEQKNHPMFIKAFAKIANKYPEKRAHIFGDGSLEKELQELINQLGMKDRILLEGNSDRIFDALHTHQYFIMTSNYEGLSNALLEAMISGMVCISTEWSGVEDVIDSEVNGYLTPLNDFNSLAELMCKVFESDNKCVCNAGIQTAREYQSKKIIDNWFYEIDSIIKS